ncbi:Programmed cell death protein 6 [Fasciola gigantica]|uniref:Programmed cell death protein 6 n=1 Tax=Fasciola gigantica TaxID=46835 RepID=A0A504YP20_FASGI|nr:Programmed cell death protein 6 [Fasciola gigantica]
MNNQQVQSFFQQVDRDNSGSISPMELQQALHNGLSTQFNMKTIELMMAMFDRDLNGTMSFPEFSQLFGYVQQWMNCFRQFDQDRSGTISCNEMQTALTSFGFRLSPQFINLLIRKFDRTKRGQIAFDDFIYCCVCLQNLTNAFMVYDINRNGFAQFHYEQFLTAALSIII